MAVYAYTGDDFGPDAAYFMIFSPAVGRYVYGFVTSKTEVLIIHFGCGWTREDFVLHEGLGPPLIELPSD